MINWKITKEESDIIVAIVMRIQVVCRRSRVTYDPREANMDLTATHANGCPLRLDELLEADKFDFAHDIFGIKKNINRKTGEIENCFLPRYAQHEKVQP